MLRILKSSQNKKKLDEKVKQLVFVRYSTNCYRLWDPENRKILLSRDVYFNKTERVRKPLEEKVEKFFLDESDDKEDFRGRYVAADNEEDPQEGEEESTDDNG